jgi:hypothetical protein
MKPAKKIPKDSAQPLYLVSQETREARLVPPSWKKLVLYVFEEKLSSKSKPTSYVVGYDSLIENPSPTNLFYEGLYETEFGGRRRIKSEEEYLFVFTEKNKFKSLHFSQNTLQKWTLTRIISDKDEISSILS